MQCAQAHRFAVHDGLVNVGLCCAEIANSTHLQLRRCVLVVQLRCDHAVEVAIVRENDVVPSTDVLVKLAVPPPPNLVRPSVVVDRTCHAQHEIFRKLGLARSMSERQIIRLNALAVVAVAAPNEPNGPRMQVPAESARFCVRR